jgi:hypothetical protein
LEGQAGLGPEPGSGGATAARQLAPPPPTKPAQATQNSLIAAPSLFRSQAHRRSKGPPPSPALSTSVLLDTSAALSPPHLTMSRAGFSFCCSHRPCRTWPAAAEPVGVQLHSTSSPEPPFDPPHRRAMTAQIVRFELPPEPAPAPMAEPAKSVSGDKPAAMPALGQKVSNPIASKRVSSSS